MPRLSSQGGFDEELLVKVKEQLSGKLEFSEQREPLDRNKAGMPSTGGFIEQHFDFRQCSRGAGDTYGIPDNKKCRQGADMGAGKKEKEEKKGSSKSGGGGGGMSDSEKKDLQVKASKGDKGAMKTLNSARAAGKIGKEAGFESSKKAGGKGGAASASAGEKKAVQGIKKGIDNEAKMKAAGELKKTNPKKGEAAEKELKQIAKLEKEARALSKKAGQAQAAFRADPQNESLKRQMQVASIEAQNARDMAGFANKRLTKILNG